MKTIRFAFCLLFVLICGCAGRNQEAVENRSNSKTNVSKNCKTDFGLYVFSYGRSLYPDRFLNVEEDKGNREIVYLFYLIRVPGKNILIDSGFFNDIYRKKFGFYSFERPDVLLKRCGIDPKEITDIVLTHFHFDHAGGIFLFPSATVHIQNHDLDLLKKQSYFPNQANYIRSLSSVNRIHSFDGTYSLLTDMRILFTGGHTPGSQALEWIASPERRFLFTGDECYLIQECKNGIGLPQGAVFSTKRNRDFIEYVRILNEKGIKILTLHDPSILTQGEELAPGVRILDYY
ncbi:N-acyl homoserine lactonase family protein [Leptospira sp. FAT2]|uniref:N-acyl homoserine lactonase family protein n=1 Tax=Leptospira sanjuanensis TaxID=2879643 RepID=UPI001EE890F9|nr:N-acyl homoserine lactonase family protein [Leptospira sanjuanensis]